MEQDEIDEIAKALDEVFALDPPLVLSWRYNTYVARKAFEWSRPFRVHQERK